MSKNVLLMMLITLLGYEGSGTALAEDLLDVRAIPQYASGTLLIEGVLAKGKARSGLKRRDRFLGLMNRWSASQSLHLETPTASQTIQVDELGMFSFTMPTEDFAATLTFLLPGQVRVTRSWKFPRHPNRLIISDVDDTILVTDVKNRVKLVWHSLFRSVEKRRSVPGTPKLYRELTTYPDDGVLMVYLTSSPAFLSRFINEFLQQHHFPPGILLTKRSLTGAGHASHKLGWLRKLAALYPKIPITLLGDTGEKDPEIFLTFAQEFPTRIGVVLLHKVGSGRQGRRREAPVSKQRTPESFQGKHLKNHEILKEFQKRGIPCLLWDDPDRLNRELIKLGQLASPAGGIQNP